jgi:actin-related protein
MFVKNENEIKKNFDKIIFDKIGNVFDSSIDNYALVLENGAKTIKYNFAGEDDPKIFTTKQKNYTYKNNNFPIEKGYIKNFEEMEEIWEHIFKNEIKIKQENPIIFLYPFSNLKLKSKIYKEKIAESFFEYFNFKYFYLLPQEYSSIYSFGLTTGVSLSLNDSYSTVISMFDGYCFDNSFFFSDIGCKDISFLLSKFLEEKKIKLKEDEIREIKDKNCFVSLEYENEVNNFKNEIDFKLPDGKIIKIGNELIKSTEVYFNPSLVGKKNEDSLQNCCFKSLNSINDDIKNNFYDKIAISGCSSFFQGMNKRIEKELFEKNNLKVKCFDKKYTGDKRYASWIGGSLLGSLSTYSRMYVSYKEYLEEGVNCIERKCN